jgi:hypothetical protein
MLKKPITVHVSTKVVKLVVGIIAQLVKQAKVPWDILVLFILALKTMHLTILERQNFKTCFKLNQPLLPL